MHHAEPPDNVHDRRQENRSEKVAGPKWKERRYQEARHSKEPDCSIEVAMTAAETTLPKEKRASNSAKRNGYRRNPADGSHGE